MAAEGGPERVRTGRTWLSVNGAATGWPRKAVRHARNVLTTAGRQWGRDRMAAEGRPGRRGTGGRG